MKKTKQQIIEELEKEVKLQKEAKEIYKKELQSVADYVGAEEGYYPNETSLPKAIIERIREIKSDRNKLGDVIREVEKREVVLKKENEKLWYLIRKTLGEDVKENPFRSSEEKLKGEFENSVRFLR
jgi:hypothetical protein